MSNEYIEEKIKSPINGTENCFKVYSDTETHYLCMSTGYMSSHNFKLEDTNFQEQINNSPELVKSLQHYDEETDLIWIPTVLNMGKLGMIFPEGNLSDWNWCYAKNVEITEEEREKYPVPGKEGEFFRSRLDIENAERFAKDKFIDACSSMGIIKDGKINTTGATDGE